MELKTTHKELFEMVSKYPLSKEGLENLFPECFKDQFWKKEVSTKIYYRNTITNETFSVGDEITISPKMRFGDEVRNHIIRDFLIYEDSENNETGYFKKVYALFENYSIERALTLDEIIKI